jgi:hypothetical protein
MHIKAIRDLEIKKGKTISDSDRCGATLIEKKVVDRDNRLFMQYRISYLFG